MAARPYAKAPAPVVMAPSWTGFYIFGGGGGGLWSANGGVDTTATGVCIVCTNTRTGGDGWFGTVGAGYDWQTGPSWVFGIFGDGTFGSLKGNIGDADASRRRHRRYHQDGNGLGSRCSCRLSRRSERPVLRQRRLHRDLLDRRTLLSSILGTPSGLHTDSFNTQGWFVGGGVENNLNFFGINAPGWFMKTEYRAAYLDSKRLHENGRWHQRAGSASDITFKPFVQTISTSLVYRFNWGGAPIAAKY